MDQCSFAPACHTDITEQNGALVAFIGMAVDTNGGRAQLIPAIQHLPANDLSINYPHFTLTYNQSVEQTQTVR